MSSALFLLSSFHTPARPAWSSTLASSTLSQCEPSMKEKNTLHTYDTEDQDDAPIWSDEDFALTAYVIVRTLMS